MAENTDTKLLLGEDNHSSETLTSMYVQLSNTDNVEHDHTEVIRSMNDGDPNYRYSVENEVIGERSSHSILAQNMPLPEGKSFHLFVSHRGDDSEEVWNLIRELEQRFGIRCLYADRDFQPGKDITDNIKEGIERSLKTLLIISPGYLDSGYCWFELKVAFQTSVMHRQNSLIPLILKSFDGELPSALGHLTYIDCAKERDVAARVFDALQDNDESLSLDDGKENETFKNAEIAMQQNGAVLIEMEAEPYYSSCSGAGWEFKALNTEQREHLHAVGIKIHEEYEKLRNEMNKKYFLQFLGMRRSWKRRCCAAFIVAFLSLSIFNAASIYWIMFASESNDHDNMNIEVLPIWRVIVWSVVLSVCFISSCVFGCQCTNKKFKEGATICWKHTKTFYQKHKCFILCDVPNDKPRILFIRYDIEKCKEYLIHFYQRRRPELSVDSHEDFAVDAIETYLERNQQRLVDWRTLPTSFMNRHNTFRQKACLCQLVLDEIII